MIKAVADALDIALGDLLAEPSLMEWTSNTGLRTVPALRDTLLDYRQITMFGRSASAIEPPTIDQLTRQVGELWDAYQASRFGYVTARLPELLTQAQAAVEVGSGRAGPHRLLGLTYQLATTQLTKLGEVDLAWIAAERGLAAVRHSGDIAVIGSLTRSVVHALQSVGKYREAVRLTEDAAGMFDRGLHTIDGEILSIYGTLFLAGAMAAARANDRTSTQSFLTEADDAARRLGQDGNHLWTAFGPTNVAMHRVATAAELGDVQLAIDLGPRIDTSSMPTERRARHALEVARAYNRWNRNEEAQATLLYAEQMAPEQVRYHYLGRQLVVGWLRRSRGKPAPRLVALAKRMNLLQ